MKFLPTYQLSFETADTKEHLTFSLPYSCDFTVSRDNLAAANTANFRIRNLNEQTRNLCYHDAYNWTDRRSIQFRAGYAGYQPLIFNGTIKSAYSTRHGTDMITEIEAQDGAFQMVNGFISTTQVAGQTDAGLLKLLATNLPQIEGTPIIGDFPVVNSRGTVLFGNTWSLIQGICAGQAIIDNNQVKILGQNEVIAPGNNQIPLITSRTGLLESPRRGNGNNFVEIEMLFEPRMTVGQLVQLESSTAALFNGTYKVVGFTHRGTMSTTVDGKRTTRAALYKGDGTFGRVPGTPVQ